MEDIFKYSFIALLYILVGVGLKYVLKRYHLKDSRKIIDVFWIKFISNALIILGVLGIIVYVFLLCLYLSI